MKEKLESFRDAPLPAGLLKALDEMGCLVPTQIQAQTIPIVLSNRDLLASIDSEEGKTAAFCIPLVTRLEKNHNRSALILVPTSKLAAQIENVLEDLVKYLPKLTIVALVSGMSMPAQVKKVSKKPRVIIATPGRLVDHLRKGTVSLFKTDILVLDEADRMLEMGLAPELNEIVRFFSSQRQTLMFASHINPHIKKLSAKYLRDPMQIHLGSDHSSKAPDIKPSPVQTRALRPVAFRS